MVSSGLVYVAGTIVKVQDTYGVVFDNAAAVAQGKANEFVAGEQGVLVYDCEKIMLPKLADSLAIVFPGDDLFALPTGTGDYVVTPTNTGALDKIAVAVDYADGADCDVMADLTGHTVGT